MLSGVLSIPALYLVPDSLSKTEISRGLGICCKMPLMTSSSMEGPFFAESNVLRNSCSSGFLLLPQEARIRAATKPISAILITFLVSYKIKNYAVVTKYLFSPKRDVYLVRNTKISKKLHRFAHPFKIKCDVAC